MVLGFSVSRVRVPASRPQPQRGSQLINLPPFLVTLARNEMLSDIFKLTSLSHIIIKFEAYRHTRHKNLRQRMRLGLCSLPGSQNELLPSWRQSEETSSRSNHIKTEERASEQAATKKQGLSFRASVLTQTHRTMRPELQPL